MAIKITNTTNQTSTIDDVLASAFAARKAKKRLTVEQKIALIEYDARINGQLEQADSQAKHKARLSDAEREQQQREIVRERIEQRQADNATVIKPAAPATTARKDLTKLDSGQAQTVVSLNQQTFQTYLYPPTSGRALWTLTHVVLLINKQFDGKKAPFVPKGNISNFYGSSTVVSHHLKLGNFEQDSKGRIRLSANGHNYFSGRLNGMNAKQRIYQKDIDDCMAMLKGPAVHNKTREINIIVSN